MNLAVIIPSFNRRNEITKLVKELRNQKNLNGVNIHIFVVIDGSTDGTAEALTDLDDNIHLVHGSGNWWYTKSINEGIKASKKIDPDLFLLLNDDTHIKTDYLEILLNAYQNVNEPCLLGTVSVSIEKPHRITFSGIRKSPKFPFQPTHYIPFMALVKLSELKGVVPSLELPGRGMLIPKMIIEQVFGLDEKFPQYFSDIDFSRRVKKIGYPIYVSYEAITYSHVAKTSDSSTFKPISHTAFLRNLLNPFGRKHIGQVARYVWRHNPKISFPFYYLRWIGMLFVNHIRVNVLKTRTYGN